MKPYSQLTEEEKIRLSNEDFDIAVKLEAIERGVAPPMTISEAIKRSEFRGFHRPADTVTFFEATLPREYGGHCKGSGLCYRTQEEARAACEGAIAISEEGYGASARLVVKTGEFSVREVATSLTKPGFSAPVLETFINETKAFDAIGKECSDDWGAIQQREYDMRVNAEKRAQYLALAQGNEEIARAFWKKAERGDWDFVPIPREASTQEAPTVAINDVPF